MLRAPLDNNRFHSNSNSPMNFWIYILKMEVTVYSPKKVNTDRVVNKPVTDLFFFILFVFFNM